MEGDEILAKLHEREETWGLCKWGEQFITTREFEVLRNGNVCCLLRTPM